MSQREMHINVDKNNAVDRSSWDFLFSRARHPPLWLETPLEALSQTEAAPLILAGLK